MGDPCDKSILPIKNWLYINAFLVLCMAVIGAITRLSESGLSMIEWRPLIGAIPPLNEDEWNRVFALYQDTPQYQHVNAGMSLAEFKTIFFWEWFHRLFGRIIGLAYAIPLVWFWIKGQIPTGYKKPLLGLLFLGAGQAVMGYIMVKSGLIDRPSVSHYRLAAHLGLAFVIFGALLWVTFSLSNIKPKHTFFCLRRHGWVSMTLLSITIIWGAFMAGQDAGLISTTWPMMYEGQFMPDTTTWTIWNNPELIHFTHRWIACVTLMMIVAFAWRVKSVPLAIAVTIQFLLGVITIMTQVHLHVAATHQAGAFITTGLLLFELYKVKKA